MNALIVSAPCDPCGRDTYHGKNHQCLICGHLPTYVDPIAKLSGYKQDQADKARRRSGRIARAKAGMLGRPALYGTELMPIERQVALLYGAGLDRGQIMQQTGLRLSQVKNAAARARNKLGIASVGDFKLWAENEIRKAVPLTTAQARVTQRKETKEVRCE